MPIRLTYKVVNPRGALRQVRARVEIANNLMGVFKTRGDILQFVQPFQSEDGRRFRRRSARSFKRLSIASVIWTREREPSGAPFSSMRQVIGATAAAFPLRDENFLHDGVAGPQEALQFKNASFVRLIKRGRSGSIVFGPIAGYASSHVTGGGTLFSFDADSQSKLRRRVPPPNNTLNAKRVSKSKLKGSKLSDFKRTELRPYYVLLGIARKFYGTGEASRERGIVAGGFKRATIPQRSWISPYSKTTTTLARLFLEGKINEFIALQTATRGRIEAASAARLQRRFFAGRAAPRIPRR